jgi:caa(3)-type oxidase subunit IV
MSQSHSVDLNIRRYLIVFGCMIVCALLTVGISLAPLGNHKLNIALALVTVAVQAFLVLGFMMHLLSERHTIYSVLGFTGFFLVFLMLLTVWSVAEVPNHPHPGAKTAAVEPQPAH